MFSHKVVEYLLDPYLRHTLNNNSYLNNTHLVSNLVVSCNQGNPFDILMFSQMPEENT